MRYRALSDTGDYTFGAGPANFLVDTPEAVAQSVLTRLRLWQGEWFLDVTVGTPWLQQILGTGKGKALRDLAIQTRVLQTTGVSGINTYESIVDPTTRKMSIKMTLTTIYGNVLEPIEVVL